MYLFVCGHSSVELNFRRSLSTLGDVTHMLPEQYFGVFFKWGSSNEKDFPTNPDPKEYNFLLSLCVCCFCIGSWCFLKLSCWRKSIWQRQWVPSLRSINASHALSTLSKQVKVWLCWINSHYPVFAPVDQTNISVLFTFWGFVSVSLSCHKLYCRPVPIFRSAHSYSSMYWMMCSRPMLME